VRGTLFKFGVSSRKFGLNFSKRKKTRPLWVISGQTVPGQNPLLSAIVQKRTLIERHATDCEMSGRAVSFWEATMRISKIGFVILGAAAIGNSVAAQTPPVNGRLLKNRRAVIERNLGLPLVRRDQKHHASLAGNELMTTKAAKVSGQRRLGSACGTGTYAHPAISSFRKLFTGSAPIKWDITPRLRSTLRRHRRRPTRRDSCRHPPP
jgi:hypothetical protein